ncbi:hypothetical protein RQP46_001890 [Phenoliferia psychrophenolica]
MHVILCGASGSVGSEILTQSLLHPSISKVTILVRKPLSPIPSSAKLSTILHQDFLSYPPALLSQLSGADGCIWSIGVTGMEADATSKSYEVITKDFAIEAAKAFGGMKRDEGKGKFVFAFLSAAAADQREGKAWMKAGAVRGDAERIISSLQSTLPLATYMFRPAPVLPVTPGYYDTLSTIQKVRFYVFDRFVIRADVIARAMLQAVLEGGSGAIQGWEGKGKEGNEGTFGIGEMKALGASSVLAAGE